MSTGLLSHCMAGMRRVRSVTFARGAMASPCRGGGRHRKAILPVLFGLVGLLAAPASSVANQQRPGLYEIPGIENVRDYESSSAEEAIDPFGGKLQWIVTDLVVPGVSGMDIKVQRTYMTRGGPPVNAFRSPVGVNWKIHFGTLTRYLGSSQSCPDTSTSSFPAFQAPDGKFVAFYPPFAGSSVYGAHYKSLNFFVSKDRWIAKCAYDGNGFAYYTVLSPDGTQYTLKQINANGVRVDWYTTEIRDRNGNRLYISYLGGTNPSALSGPMVKRVSSSDGRYVYFNYQNEPQPNKALLQSIQANGRYVSYQYDTYYLTKRGFANHAFLSRVVYPEGESWTYNYKEVANDPAEYNLIQVKDRFGKWTSYGYDRVAFVDGGIPELVVRKKKTGTTSTNFSGGIVGGAPPGDAYWTYTYTPGGYTAMDKTTVQGPTSTVEYDHHGYVTYTNTYADLRWKPGLLAQKRTCAAGRNSCPAGYALQIESLTWGNQKVSDYADATPGLSYQDVVAPILLERQVTRDGTVYKSVFSNHDAWGNPRTIVETGNQGSRERRLTYFAGTTPWVLHAVKSDETLGVVSGTNGLVTNDYDAVGNLKATTRYGVTTRFTYHASGELRSTEDARTLRTFHSQYYRGVPRRTDYADGSAETRVVNADGTVQSVTNRRGYTTAFTYDGMLRLKSVDYPLGDNVNVGRTISSGLLTHQTTTRGGFKETVAYGIFGKPTSVSRQDVSKPGSLIQVNFNYDAAGRLTFESLPNDSRGVSTSYDALDRVRAVTYADGRSIRYDYLSGNRVVVTNERGLQTTHTYRSYGDPDDRALVSMAAPEGVVTSIARDKLGNIRTITQGHSSGADTYVREFGYDNRFFLTSRTDPEVGTVTFGRDPVGNMFSRQVNNLPATNYQYDRMNRLSRVRHSSVSGLPTIDYQYDANGNVTSVGYGEVERAYSYDANDNLLSEVLTFNRFAANPITAQLGYTYSGLDHLSTIQYPSGRLVSLSPNALGQQTAASPLINAVTYFPNGQIKRVGYANGVVSDFGQEPTRLRLSGITVTSGSQELVGLSYGYDATGNLATLHDRIAAATSWTLSYDGVDRLVAAEGPLGNHVYTYDAVGNLKSSALNGDVTHYNYDVVTNRLTTLSGAVAESFDYDGYGNVSSNAAGDYTYTEAGHLVHAAAARAVDFAYDGAGMMVSKSVDGTPRYYVYARSGDLLAELDQYGDWEKEYVQVGGHLVATIEPEPNRPPVLATMPDVAFAEGDSVALDLSTYASDPDADVLAYQVSGLPAGLGFDAATGQVSGSLGYEGEGTYTVDVTVTDRDGLSGSGRFILSVANTNRVPVLWDTVYLSVPEGDYFTFPWYASDPDGDQFTFAVTGFPPGVDVDPATGVVSGTPGYDSAGVYALTLTITDDGSPPAALSVAMEMTVTDTNRPPTVDPLPDVNLDQGAAVSISVNAVDADGDSLTYSASGLPAGLGIDSASGVISGTLNSSQIGPYPVVVTVTDSGSPILDTSVNFKLTVAGSGSPPVITAPGDQSAVEGSTFNLAISASSPDGKGLVFSASGLPKGMVIDSATGRISGTLGFDQAGVYQVTVTATDTDGLDASAGFTFTVADAARAPVVTHPGDQEAAEGSSYSIAISAYSPDGRGLSFSASGLPTGVGIDATTGVISGALAYDQAGIYQVTVLVTDTAGIDEKVTFKLTVTDTARPPVVTNPGDQTVAEGDAFSLVLSASSPDGRSLSFSASGLPKGVGMGNAPDVISGTLAYDQAGVYQVTVTVTDSAGLQARTSFKLTVTDTPRPPVVTHPYDQGVDEGATFYLAISASSPDGRGLTFSASGLPKGVVMDSATGVISGTLGYDQAGIYQVPVTVTDSLGLQASTHFSLWVRDVAP